MKIKIIGGGRGCGKTQSELARALEKLEKQNLVNKLLLAQKMNLESENARLKADMKEIARRDLQIAEEADKLNQKYEVECVKFKNLMLNVEKAREEIRKLDDINPDYPMDRKIHVSRNEVLEILDKLIESGKE